MLFAQAVSEWLYARKHSSCQDGVEYHYSDLPHPRTKRYRGKLYYADPVSRKKRLATPEEKVRQRIILFLHYDMGVPYDAMEIEVPLSRFWKRATGRMDIAVYAADQRRKKPILVVECKAEHIQLTEQVYRQADNYAVSLDIPFVAITNGRAFFMDYWDGSSHTYQAMKQLPSYARLCSLVQAGTAKDSAPDLEASKEGSKYRCALREGILGARTPPFLADALLAVHQCWMDRDRYCTGLTGFAQAKDCGAYQRGTPHRNGYPDLFRHFCGTGEDGRSFSAYLCIYAPKIPKVKKGPTYLAVYLEDVSASPALQLRAEEFITRTDNRIHIWHDGRLNIGGKHGAAPRNAIIELLRQCAHDLLDETGQVDLGTVLITPDLRMDQSDMAQVCSRLIRYAMIRMEYRRKLLSDSPCLLGQ